ncbi:hypothetical protein DW022_09860 [Ruminococcus sp. AF37-6AT]|jgi:hypothetical protein|nr:hypothetical protein DXD97_08630 [Ruminococcus sp. TM10-9AT]RHJ96825.1 hypothetical protein DW098_09380 [Ruminococcus sp. AM07-21]RHL47506.1 hypothetical protein DW022_09860 [Ruminococcus sp. AF37-6AT]RHP57534.1 hypothetical protein DWZ27_07425 [Ruminococcus sp. AF31-16BH]
MKTRKKWLRKTTAICTAALLGTAVIPSTAFAADDYASIEKNAWAAAVKNMASSYAASIEESQALVSGMQSDISLKIEDSGRSLLGFVAPFDISWLNDITLANTVSFTDGKEGLLMKVLLNDNQICSLEYYLDPESQDVYMRIPELSDKYFKTNLKEAADQQASNIESDIEELTPDDTDVDIPTDNFASAYSDSISLSASLMSDLSSALPEASVIETLLDKYGSMLFDNLTEGESSQETLTAGDISQDCTVYEGQISSEDAVKTATELLEAAKSDSDIESILNTWNDKLSSDENLYESFTTAVDKGLNALKDTDTSDSEDSYLSTKIWVDENGRIAGRALEIQEGDTTTPILTWQMPENGSDFGYLLTIASDDINTYSLSGSGQIDGDKLNGTYELSLADSISAIIEVKDYDTVSAKEGNLNGNYKITFPSSDTDNEDDYYSSILENFALVLDLNSEKDSGSVALSIENAGSTLGTLSITGGAGEAVEIPDLASLKDVYDANNNDDMNAYAATLDFTSIMDNLSKAGVPDEVITYILSGGSATEDSSDTKASENSETSDNTSDGSDTDAAA